MLGNRKRVLRELEEMYRAVVALRDESDTGAKIIAQSEIAQRIIGRGWTKEGLIKRKDIAPLREALSSLRTEIANTKHQQHVANVENFWPLYYALWQKYCDSKSWQISREGEGAVFCSHTVTLSFGYDETAYVICKAVVQELSKLDPVISARADYGTID